MSKNDNQPKVYLVGGAVRDDLLGLPVKERDWVVVGSTPEKMLAQGFQPVGKDFPVFLHPDTKEEYALARTERKTAKGYKGFTFHAEPDITLEEDLKRRDLTINAIAQDDDGTIIDPYHGRKDLDNKLLRHVSPAFAEDPVRILRLARFAAKLPEFRVDDTTNQLMQKMVDNGEVDALVAERVWQELKRALGEKKPSRFFDVLNKCNAITRLFPELAAPTLDIDNDDDSPQQRFATLCSGLSNDDIHSLCKRYRIASDFAELAKQAHALLPLYKKLDTKNATEILHFIKRADALRRPERFDSLLHVLTHLSGNNQKHLLKSSADAIKNINTKKLQDQNLKGKDFADALEHLQIKQIKKI